MDTHLQSTAQSESPAGTQRIHRILITMAALIFQSVTIGIAVVAVLLAVVNVVL